MVLLIGVVEILFAVPLLGLALAYDDVMELPSVNEQPSLNVSIMMIMLIVVVNNNSAGTRCFREFS